MRIVVDANLIAALILPLPYSEQAADKMAAWKSIGVELHAPSLLEYELASILRRAIVVGLMTTGAATEAMRGFSALNVHVWSPTVALHTNALQWAENLGQSKAYDAQYLALAEGIGAELWTADRRLARGAQQAGVGWVHWIGKVASV
jgi:predicted nucleic acid-binding protein